MHTCLCGTAQIPKRRFLIERSALQMVIANMVIVLVFLACLVPELAWCQRGPVIPIVKTVIHANINTEMVHCQLSRNYPTMPRLCLPNFPDKFRQNGGLRSSQHGPWCRQDWHCSTRQNTIHSMAVLLFPWSSNCQRRMPGQGIAARLHERTPHLCQCQLRPDQ